MRQLTKSPKVADIAWLGLALLQREHPERQGFSPAEILARIQQEHIVENIPPGVAIHISSHGVASLAPNPGAYRLFTRTPSGYRLYRAGDPVHPARTGKTHPKREDLPGYRHLFAWYDQWSEETAEPEPDPILQLRGLGKEIWAGIDGVEYQRWLRTEKDYLG
jgi:hypothetical protein